MMAELLAVAENPDQAAATLLGAALAAPASDNVTVVVADVLDDMVDGIPPTRYRTVGAAAHGPRRDRRGARGAVARPRDRRLPPGPTSPRTRRPDAPAGAAGSPAAVAG